MHKVCPHLEKFQILLKHWEIINYLCVRVKVTFSKENIENGYCAWRAFHLFSKVFNLKSHKSFARIRSHSIWAMVTVKGFEPLPTVPKTVVLPLHHTVLFAV